MTRLAVTVARGREPRHVLITAAPTATVGDLLAGKHGTGPVLVDGRPADATTSLRAAGVSDGSLVGAPPAAPVVPIAAPGTLALLVTSGPAAGASRAIPATGLTVGRRAPFTLHDGEVSREHFSICPAGDGLVITDAGSANGTVVAGERLQGSGSLAPGDLIWAGRTALSVAEAPAADAALRTGDDGQLRYSRSPRQHLRPPASRPVVLPEPPADAPPVPFPAVAAMALPVVAGVLMAVLLKQVEFLAFTALSPLMLVGNVLSERRRGRRTSRQATADYEQARQQALAGLAAARAAETAYRRYVHPDPASLVLIAVAPSHRLWERQPHDADFLELRVGTGAVTWTPGHRVQPDQPGAGLVDELSDAPVTLPLPRCGAVGIAGQPAQARGLARGLLLSAAVLHSPADVAVTVLTSPDAGSDWEWLRWLPHARQPGGHDTPCRVGNDPASTRARVAELTAVLQARHAFGADNGVRHLVVLDGSGHLHYESGLSQLLREGPAAGIYFLCLAATMADLPSECAGGVIVLADDQGAPTARVSGPDGDTDQVTPDLVAPAVAETVARKLAPVTDGRGNSAAAGLPAAVRLLTAAGLEAPDAARVADRWARGGRTTRAQLGATAAGPFAVDLAAGPHLLVAGTSGAGKSELLQTLVAALALENRPDALNFVLVDYKGGAAFRDVGALPHTTGLLTDLDEFLVDRALTSLKAELDRRKLALDAVGLADIADYWAARDAARPGMASTEPLPRLVIVVDEFAVMAERLPEQMRSLMLIGRQGRSLGVNLVLATQRPTGVVNSDLLSNMNQRIALRVASADNSQDIIGTPDAARIPAEGTAGRGYAWLGGGQPVAFQTARVSGRYPAAGQAVTVSPLDWPDLGRPVPPPAARVPESEVSDLVVLGDAIRAAAAATATARPRPPWQPPLPDVVTLASLIAAARDQPDPSAPVGARLRPSAASPGQHNPVQPSPLHYGLVDQPTRQRQVPAQFDLVRGGHLLAAGAPQSGRSTLLRTLAAATAIQAGPDDVHLYVLDGGGAMASLAALPHCGAVVALEDADRADRLLRRLAAELRTRTAALSAGGFADLKELRAAQPAGARTPYLVVLVDRYDTLVTALEGVDGARQVEQLMRDGVAAGLRFVVTGDRRLLTGRLAELAADKLVLRLADRNDYLVAGLRPGAVPGTLPPGRGFMLPGADSVHVAALTAQAEGTAENRVLRELAAAATAPSRRPAPVDALPEDITLERALALPRGPGAILAGVGGDTTGQLRVSGPGYLVISAPSRGRSTALTVAARALCADGEPLILLTPARSPLAGEADQPATRLHLAATDAAAAAALTDALGEPGAASVIADDADLLTGTPLGEALAAWYATVSRAGAGGGRLLAAVRPESLATPRGLLLQLAQGKRGLVLAPAAPGDGLALGLRLPATLLTRHRLRGALVSDGQAVAVQIPDLPPLAAVTGQPASRLPADE